MKEILILMLFITSIAWSYRISKEDYKYKSKLNTNYILEKDTLKIVDYSLLGNTFTLSNGSKINSNLVLKN